MKSQFIITILLFLPSLVFAQSTSTTNDPQDSLQIFSSQRMVIKENVQAVRNLEQQWVTLHQEIPALVKVVAENNGFTSYHFYCYKTVQPERVEQIQQRIIQSFSEITAFSLATDGKVAVTFNQASPSVIQSFFKLLGYEGYEID